jgi:triacylglycerol esterase/lipase EstA (alpha/beta hydrolase family)
MLTHFLKFVVVAWVGAVLLVVAGFWYRPAAIIPWPYVAATLFFVPLLLLQFVAAWFVNLADKAPRASWWRVMKAWVVETRLVVRVFCWDLAFALNRFPDQTDDAFSQRGRRGVVFIHGFVCNRGLWTPWLRKLTHSRRAFVAVSLTPVFGSIDRYVDTIDQAVRKVTQATGMSPMVICHSMGGLAVRAWLRASPNADARVHHIVTIGTPHHGTWLSRLPFARNARQMAIGNRWLKDLQTSEPASRYKLFTCYFSHCDNIVFPATTATLAGADNRHVVGLAHVALAFDQTVISESLAKL